MSYRLPPEGLIFGRYASERSWDHRLRWRYRFAPHRPGRCFYGGSAERWVWRPYPLLWVRMIGLTKKAFVAESGIFFHPQDRIRTAPPLDTIIVAGGTGVRRPQISECLSEWLLRDSPDRINLHRCLRFGSHGTTRRPAGGEPLALCFSFAAMLPGLARGS
jgi:hypothetical protein